MAPGWLSLAATAAVLLSGDSSPFASAFEHGFRIGGAPSYRGYEELCPSRCGLMGPDPANWDVYHKMSQLQRCTNPLLYQFSSYDNVDDENENHRIFACSIYGSDWVNPPKMRAAMARPATDTNVDVDYQLGWWATLTGDEPKMAMLAQQTRQYLESGNAATNRSTILYSRVGMTVAGMYIGQGLHQADVGKSALQYIEDNLNDGKTPRQDIALQLCGEKYGSDHTFGFISVTNGTFESVQDAIKTWSNASCLDFTHSQKHKSKTHFVTPLLSSIKGESNSTTHGVNATSSHLAARANCRTTEVKGGDGCAILASRCGISGADFTKYNSKPGMCSNLKAGQHVCCSSGTLPDYRPKPNKDGSCATDIIREGQDCSIIAAKNGLEVKDLDEFNKKTWGWVGCNNNIFANTVLCVSKGTPPMPAPMKNAICGPQVPGTKEPSNKDDLGKLNPCPLNACCDVWGQCGTTKDFCTDTNTGAPGTAKPKTNGCISNCGTKLVRGDPPAEFRSIGYYEGFNFERKCLYQEPLQIDTSKYTHLHFGFGDISHDYEVSMGKTLNQYAFERFKKVRGSKRILSFGGWTFSTDPATYTIFREGTKTAANRFKLATNLADFIKKHDLDGIDIDWEYPSAPDIPGIPPGDKSEGDNYLLFLIVLKNLIGDKSLSIAAPASYWYLKGFPIEAISGVVDYIVYMTYDLHGQWDAGNSWSQPDCPSGMCLRSHVNLTETTNALVMITKAGVPSNKIVTGITSYGRSFNMADPGCKTPQCQFTGTRLQSDAKKGRCTDTAGYISNAEIYEILQDKGRVVSSYRDEQSDSNILIYDLNQWVAYMDPDVRNKRIGLYKMMNMGGSVNWAIDLEEFHKPPSGLPSWSGIFLQAGDGRDPLGHPRHGNWTEIDCKSQYIEDPDVRFTPAQKWEGLDCEDAWLDVVRDWKEFRGSGREGFFSGQLEKYFVQGVADEGNCGSIEVKNGCDVIQCSEFTRKDSSGAGGSLVWNSLVQLNAEYVNFHQAIVDEAVFKILPGLDTFEDKFAPLPKADDQQWLDILISVISLGAPIAVGSTFEKVAAKLPELAAKAEKGKEWANTLTSGVAGIAGTFKKGQDFGWTVEGQHEFKQIVGKTLSGWQAALEKDLKSLFDGSDASIQRLGKLIDNGQAIGGGQSGLVKYDDDKKARKEIGPSLASAFYSTAIPALWRFSGYPPGIIDHGPGCDDRSRAIQSVDSHCYNGRLYQLITAGHKCYGDKCKDGDFLKNPPGFDEIKTSQSQWGNVNWTALIEGSVNTANAGHIGIDPKDTTAMLRAAGGDITTPGVITLPICSLATASLSARYAMLEGDYDGHIKDHPNYPCDVVHELDFCGPSTFVDQTSDASPSVADCMQLVKNLLDPTYSDSVGSQASVPNSGQKEFWSYKSCKFGAQHSGSRKGNTFWLVGRQDAADVIRDSVKKFGHTGKVGSYGTMQCKGSENSDSYVLWGLY